MGEVIDIVVFCFLFLVFGCAAISLILAICNFILLVAKVSDLVKIEESERVNRFYVFPMSEATNRAWALVLGIRRSEINDTGVRKRVVYIRKLFLLAFSIIAISVVVGRFIE